MERSFLPSRDQRERPSRSIVWSAHFLGSHPVRHLSRARQGLRLLNHSHSPRPSVSWRELQVAVSTFMSTRLREVRGIDSETRGLSQFCAQYLRVGRLASLARLWYFVDVVLWAEFSILGFCDTTLVG
jgi:hypothetical protein